MILTSVTRIFEASHFDQSESSHRHGHEYVVRIVQRDVDSLRLGLALETLLRELHLRDLDEMIPGANTSLEGIAAWVLERLILEHGGIVEVWVSVGPESNRRSAVVTREIR